MIKGGRNDPSKHFRGGRNQSYDPLRLAYDPPYDPLSSSSGGRNLSQVA